MEAEQAMVDINWDFGESMSVEFLTAYTSQFNKLANDWDGSQYDVVYDLNQQDNELWSQEVQFSGGRGRVTWLGGAYYWEQDTTTRDTRNVVGEFFSGQYDINNVLNSPICTGPVPAGMRSCNQIIFGANGNPALGIAGAAQLRGNGYDRIPHNERDGYAAFGDVTIELGERNELSIGARYHEENVMSEQTRVHREHGAAANHFDAIPCRRSV